MATNNRGPDTIWDLFEFLENHIVRINELSEAFRQSYIDHSHDAYFNMLLSSPHFRYVLDELKYVEGLVEPTK